MVVRHDTGGMARREACCGAKLRPWRDFVRLPAWALVALATVLAVVAVMLVSGEPGLLSGAPGGGDPAGALDKALADGTPVYVLIHSAT